MNRREFIGGALAASVVPTVGAVGVKPEYHAFSRVFQFLKDPYRAADFLKSCGYDGVEWTVRKGGFLAPDTVTAGGMKDLKSAADRAGIKAANIVVDFLRGDIVCLKDFYFALDDSGRDWKRVLVPAGKGIVDFAEVRRLMELEGVAPRYTVHYDYDFPGEEAEARRFAVSDLRHYRSVLG